MSDHALLVGADGLPVRQENLQDRMEMGALESEKNPKQKDVRMGLADALAMLGLQHAHIIHEADPDTKVVCLTLPSW